MPDLAIEPERRALLILHVRHRALRHPSRAMRSCVLLCRARRRRIDPIPRPSWWASRLTSTTQARCLSPTSATDIHNNEHPTQSLDSRAPGSRRDDRLHTAPLSVSPKSPWERGVGPPFGNPTPGEPALDGAAQLRSVKRIFPPLIIGGERGPTKSREPRLRGVFSRRERCDRDLWRSLSRPAVPLEKPGSREEPRPLPLPARQREQLSRPEAPSLDTCGAYLRRQRPPPISRLCRRDPASGVCSPARCSRTNELDPLRLRGLIARGREDLTPRVDFCNQYDRRAQLPDRSNPAHRAEGRPQAQLHWDRRGCLRLLVNPTVGRPSPFRSPASRDVTGQGRVFGFDPKTSSFHHDRSWCKLHPNPIGSDTFCRKLAP